MEFANGLFFNEPPEKIKEWHRGFLAINPERFIPWLQEQEVNDKGSVKLKICISKKGKPYVAVDDFVPRSNDENDKAPAEQPTTSPAPADVDGGGNDIPF